MSNPAASALVVVVAVTAMMFNFSLHKIDEGNVGVYYRGGALLKVTSNPGYHMMIPFLTTHRSVQVKKQINPSLSQDANYGANRSPCNLMK